jgi:cytochrome bd-type quinol oxidase subunit 1
MPWIVHEQLTTASIVQSHYYAPLTIVGRVLFAFFMVLLLFFLIYLKQQRNYTQK